jgi:hypothetical protein
VVSLLFLVVVFRVLVGGFSLGFWVWFQVGFQGFFRLISLFLLLSVKGDFFGSIGFKFFVFVGRFSGFFSLITS